MNKNKPYFTVFTPTYNRAYCLQRVYDSLKAQTDQDFEWVIVDDGSTDNTKEVVDVWIAQDLMDISYRYQTNAGKHVAINTGADMASGHLFLIADSDDGFVPKTLETFRTEWEQLPNKTSFAGVWCLCQDLEGNIVGDNFPTDKWDANYFERIYKHNITGEKWHVELLSVIKEFPFPDIRLGEGFYYGEGTIWNAIYKKYKARHINKALRIYYDSPDGIMATMANNPHRDETVLLGAVSALENDLSYFFYKPSSFVYAAYKFLQINTRKNISLLDGIKSLKSSSAKLLVGSVAPIWLLYNLVKK